MTSLAVKNTIKNESLETHTTELDRGFYYIKYVRKEEVRAKMLLIALPVCFIAGVCSIFF